MAARQARGNRLLTALPKSDYKLLSPMLEQVRLVYNETIYEAGKPIRHIYFPESGIISLLSGVSENSTIEVGIVGNEGMVGLPVYLGVERSSTRALVQGAGSALRMEAADFIKFSARSPKLQTLMLRYIHSLFTQVSQSAACNRFHPIDERLARWLMMTRDRMGSSKFQITQEFLSNMLGIRREAVNKAAGILQERGLVSYLRGNMKILDRKGLERAACTCYKIIKAEYDWKLN
jgi:CRP-like cAMP-binding protein